MTVLGLDDSAAIARCLVSTRTTLPYFDKGKGACENELNQYLAVTAPSTRGEGLENTMESTAPEVYRPTPGSVNKFDTPEGILAPMNYRLGAA